MWEGIITSKTDNYDVQLTTGSVTQKLFQYSLPLIGTSLLQSVYSISDMVVVGRFVNGAAISSINNASLIMNLLTQIIIGLTMGGSILISQYLGAGDDKNRKESTGSLFTICICIGLLCGVLFYFSANSLLIMLKAPELSTATSYLKICAMGLPFIFGYNALSAILRAMGNSRKPMQFILISSTINVATDILFVAGFGWGVNGAAWSTLLAQIIAFLMALFYLIAKRDHYGFHAKYFMPTSKKVLSILKLGLPLSLQWTVASISWLAVAFLINKYGVDYSAGNGISSRIKDFCQLIITSLASGASTMVALNIGSKQYDRAEQVMRTCMKVTLAIAAVMIIVMELTAPQLASIFTKEQGVLKWAVINLRIEIVAQLFYAGFYTYNTLATGSGNTVFVMMNSFVNCILVRLVLAFVFERIWGVYGIYIACLVAPASSIPIGYLYYRSGKWKRSLIASPGTDDTVVQ